jgi:hypothetical protein
LEGLGDPCGVILGGVILGGVILGGVILGGVILRGSALGALGISLERACPTDGKACKQYENPNSLDHTDASKLAKSDSIILLPGAKLVRTERNMANKFGTDILIHAAAFYVDQLGFEITDETPAMVSLHGKHINLFIERGPALGPVLEVTVESVEDVKRRLLKHGCQIVKDEPRFPRCYIKDPFGLIYNLTE